MSGRSALELLDDMILELEQTLHAAAVSSAGDEGRNASAAASPSTSLSAPAVAAAEVRGEAGAPGLGLDALELRCGVIVSAHRHPEADRLYCELIDVGEEQPRAIASGLVAHYSLEELQGRRVVVVCNLPARKLVGFRSEGMVLCAASGEGADERVELLAPPEGCLPGARLSAQGCFGPPLSAKQCDKQGAWKALQPQLAVRGGAAFWGAAAIGDGQGQVCTSTRVLDGALR